MRSLLFQRLSRLRCAFAAAMAAPLAAGVAGCAGRTPAAPDVTAGCYDIAVWSNGVHTSLSLPAAALPADHVLRAQVPAARHLLIGWRDAAFYRSDGGDVWLGVRALIPPSPSAVHVLGSEAPAEDWFTPKEAPRFAISQAGAEGLAAYLDAAVARHAAGAPGVLGPGQVAGASVFLKGSQGFHALSVCNHWTARALRSAGLEVRTAGAFTAAAVKRQVRHLPTCEEALAAPPRQAKRVGP